MPVKHRILPALQTYSTLRREISRLHTEFSGNVSFVDLNGFCQCQAKPKHQPQLKAGTHAKLENPPAPLPINSVSIVLGHRFPVLSYLVYLAIL